MSLIPLAAGSARAEIALKGAEARGWTIAGRQLLWTPDPSIWAETAPILFPIVGWTNAGRVRIGQSVFRLGLHGFARELEFALVEQTKATVRLELESSAKTRAIYPFEFHLGVEYRLTQQRLSTILTITNRGDAQMPYAIGLHPGFCWPFAGGQASAYRTVFEAEEEPWVPEISPKGLFLATRRRIALEGRVLPLTHDLFAKEALCFLNARSREIRFEHEGGAAIVVATEDFPHFALWTRPGAGFLSIETWTGHGDPDGFAGDLFEKPGMRLLAPAQVACHAAHYIFEDIHV